MKKLFSLLVTSLLMFSIMPMILAANSAGTTGGVAVVVDDPDDVCEAPKIYVDPTSAVLNPNAENTETAAIYDTAITDDDHPYGDEIGYRGDRRSDYIFTGETMTYYVAVYDANGEDDIAGANVLVNAVVAGVCTNVTDAAVNADTIAYLNAEYLAGHDAADADEFINDGFDIPAGIAFAGAGANDVNWKFFQCVLSAGPTQLTEEDVTFNAIDGGEVVCAVAPGAPTTVIADWDDTLDFNPTLALTLTGGALDFGSAQEGSVAHAGPVTLTNNAEDSSDVMMDMYISAPDYFWSLGGTGFCPTASGIAAARFSYFATNGVNDSSTNDGATHAGLGLGAVATDCDAVATKGNFVPLPAGTTNVAGMCRIINTGAADGLLQEGEPAMSITFRLDVPTSCEGTFDQGDFNFIGRVV